MRLSRAGIATTLALLILTTSTFGAMGAVGAQSGEDCSFPITVTDSTGTEVTLSAEPDRVVTLAPSAAQTMYEIGAQEKVVGISQRGTYLDWAEQKTVISSSGSFVSVELVVAQRPDLVLAPDIISDKTVKKLRNAGLTVYHFGKAKTLEDVIEKTRLIGTLVGACEAADARADEMEATLAAVADAVEGKDRPAVLYLMGGGWTAGKGTFINAVITTAGGTNVAARANITGYGVISSEVVANRSPEYIILSSTMSDVVPDTTVYNNTPAVRQNQIVRVNPNYLNQPAPRVVGVVEKLANTFHPRAYEPTGETTTTREPTPTETTTAP
ncbi:MAG: PGF-CTERM-anchored ABC transporter substrate-binding protein, partial [Halodesulfurarchaeum sp.]